ncbi:acetate kinase [Polymorphospora sp. NPDC051019]|uniref:acetate/propionate family kinase n=1 Tax=Polymorphospora sp. NPDC051019 TaxID=3155725 RepID=UPI0034400F77
MTVVLTVNAGSSSLHLAYVDVTAGDGGTGGPGGDGVGARLDRSTPPADAEAAVRDFVAGRPAPDMVAHRLVHGGELVFRPTVVDDGLRRALDDVAALAPLHLPPALALLDQLRRLLPDVPHLVCPDSAFHAGLPEPARTYPVPARWRERFGLRRYGFHGLSYAYATRRAGELLGRPVADLHLLLAHLGGGASVCAVRGGRSVDTSMGFTPLDGVPMSKRSGAVDPGMLLWLLDGRLTYDEVFDGLYHRSGLLGLSGGRSGDTRDLVAAAPGDPSAALAMDTFDHRVRREMAAAATSLDRLDAVVFTGEIGWDQPEVRHDVCAGLRLLGVVPPTGGNRDDDGPVSVPGAAVPVLVVRPREEFELAREAAGTLARV